MLHLEAPSQTPLTVHNEMSDPCHRRSSFRYPEKKKKKKEEDKVSFWSLIQTSFPFLYLAFLPANSKRTNYEVTLFKLFDCTANFRNFSYEFMSKDEVIVWYWLMTMVNVKVTTTQGCKFDLWFCVLSVNVYPFAQGIMTCDYIPLLRHRWDQQSLELVGLLPQPCKAPWWGVLA